MLVVPSLLSSYRIPRIESNFQESVLDIQPSPGGAPLWDLRNVTQVSFISTCSFSYGSRPCPTCYIILKMQQLLGQLRSPKWFHWVEDLLMGILFSAWLEILQKSFCLLRLLTIFFFNCVIWPKKKSNIFHCFFCFLFVCFLSCVTNAYISGY